MSILSSDIITESVENLCPQILMEPQYDRRLLKKIVDNHVNVDSVEKYILCALWRVYIVWSFCAVKSDLPFDMKKIIFKSSIHWVEVGCYR